MKRCDAVAFDLDGTLVDSAGGVAYALNTALAEAGLAGYALDLVRGWIGDGPDALIARALATPELAPLSSYQLAERLRKGFDAATLRDPMAGSSVYAGIAELLADLGALRPLVVVTNKPTTLARAVLAEAGLLHHFESVHGADMAAQRKPSPLMLRQACANLGIATGHLLMVGDAAVDIACARAAGSAAAWAGWGYGQLPAHASADVWRLAMPQELLQRLALPAGAHIATDAT